MRLRRSSKPRPCRGAATVELALVLPFLLFLLVIAVDYARIFYFGVTVQNCARNGAYYASRYPNNSYLYNDLYGYTSLGDAVTRDATDLNPTPTWKVAYGTSPDGPFNLSSAPISGGYVRVTVNWTFHTLTNYPLVPRTVNVSKSCVMKMAPDMPDFWVAPPYDD